LSTSQRDAQIGEQRKSHTAFVHDNFVQVGGGERVAEELARLLPDADIFSTVAIPERLSPYLRSRGVKTTWLQHLPWMRQLYRHYFLLYPIAARGLRLDSYSTIVSSCYGFAKMIRKPAGALHICYCHTPTRWIWRFDDYAARENFHPVIKNLLRKIIDKLKLQDLRAAQAVDVMIANSSVVADRIWNYYGKAAEVIFPPIDCDRFSAVPEQGDYYLVVSRLVPYKRVNLAIEACQKLGRKLIIIGDGPDRARLERSAGPNITFLGRAPDEVVTGHLARCRAVLFAGEEDFGLIPLEANASGRPCIAYGRGGALDTVVDGVTGVLFPEPSGDSLASAILRSETMEWDVPALQHHARQFDRAVFVEKMRHVLDEAFARQTIGSPAARPVVIDRSRHVSSGSVVNGRD
jgi:glycosyltransferase involved in cell wall biosynthesis